MTIIHLREESVRKVVIQIRDFGQRAKSSLQAIQTHFAGADWSGPSRDQLLDEYAALANSLNALADRAETMALELQAEIDQWLSVDQAGALQFQLLRAVALMPLVGGLAIADLPAFSWFANLEERFQEWFLSWWPWAEDPPVILPEYLDPQPPVDPPMETSTTSLLGDLMARTAAEEELAKTPTESLAANSLEVPIYGQDTAGGSAACAPTSMSMIMNYWHDQNSDLAGPSRDEVLQAAIDANYFEQGRGMDFNEAEKILDNYGYDASVQLFNGDDAAMQSSLKEQLGNGPVMAMVSLDTKADQLVSEGGVAHAVVIAGISNDGSMVRIHDPWEGGRAVDMSWDAFKGAWSSFDDQFDHMAIVIQPGGSTE